MLRSNITQAETRLNWHPLTNELVLNDGIPKVAGETLGDAVECNWLGNESERENSLKWNSFRFSSVRVVQCSLTVNVAGIKHVIPPMPNPVDAHKTLVNHFNSSNRKYSRQSPHEVSLERSR